MGTGGKRSAGFIPLKTEKARRYSNNLRKSLTGFTIVETMIVLAVSALLATSAMLMINGKQNATQFQVANNNLRQQLEQLINETANGFYPTTGNFTCNATTTPISISTVAGKAQGTNNNCIFLGKALALGTGGDQETIIVYPLIGKRVVSVGSTTKDVTNFDDADPTALSSDGGTYPDAADYKTAFKTQNGLSLDHVDYTDANGAVIAKSHEKYAVFAFVYQLGQYATADATQGSTTQQLDLYEYDLQNSHWPNGSAPGDSENVVSRMNFGIDSTVIGSVRLCYTSGTTNQSVKYTISGKGQLRVSSQIYGGKTCGP
jgi:type II secretory pathway pseudopilin PulG